MSNDLTLTNVQVPAHLANRMGKPSILGDAISGGISGGESFPRISIKGARFRIVEDGVEQVLDTTALDIVIVGANPHLSKTWYAKAWNKDAEPAAPDCYSLNGITPMPDSTMPQSDLCASCPKNAWGSKVGEQGQELKACADQKRLAIVPADDPSGTIYLLQVTPAALKGLHAYHKQLSSRGFAAETVKTRISFDTEASFPKLQFGFAGFLSEDAQNEVDEVIGSARVMDITGESVPAVAPVAAPAPVSTVPKGGFVKAAPAPAPEPEPEPEPAPVLTKGFGKVAAKPVAAKPAKVETPAEPKAAAAKPEAASLIDDIASLIQDMEADDSE